MKILRKLFLTLTLITITFIIYTLNISALEIYDYQYKGEVEEFVVPKSGFYKIELWGAAGGQSMMNGQMTNMGGHGAYTSGTIELKKGETIYIYVGGKGQNSGTNGKWGGAAGGYNGGGRGGADNNQDADPEPGAGGGGATDIRLIGGEWNDTTSLYSRLMVAAGASGGGNQNPGVHAGGLTGYKPTDTNQISTQINGYELGTGSNGYSNSGGSSGAGGGYYGGYQSTSNFMASGSGSSYISGHAGCIGLTIDGKPKTNAYNALSDSYNYSNRYFTDTTMIDGSGIGWTTFAGSKVDMPNYNGDKFETGNPENGHARITFLKSSIPELSDIIVEGGTLDAEITSERYTYYVEIPYNNFQTNINAIPHNEDDIVLGDTTGTLKVGESYQIILMNSSGNITIYTLIPYVSKPFPNNIEFIEKTFEFISSTYNYTLQVDNSIN